MPFIERKDGKIAGLYHNRQDGYAEEELPDDNAEVVAYLEMVTKVHGGPAMQRTAPEAATAPEAPAAPKAKRSKGT
jgi:hypothetical protein